MKSTRLLTKKFSDYFRKKKIINIFNYGITFFTYKRKADILMGITPKGGVNGVGNDVFLKANTREFY